MLRDGEAFVGSAYAFAGFMEGSVVLYADGVLGEAGESVMAGYSMVGLFALHVPCVTGTFTRCVSASGFH